MGQQVEDSVRDSGDPALSDHFESMPLYEDPKLQGEMVAPSVVSELMDKITSLSKDHLALQREVTKMQSQLEPEQQRPGEEGSMNAPVVSRRPDRSVHNHG